VTVLVLCEGTWGGENWAAPASEFRQFLEDAGGFIVVRFPGWSNNLDGISLLTKFIQHGKHRTWIGGGYAFADFVRLLRREYEDVPIAAIVHSHAVNIALYGLALSAEEQRPIFLDRLISVCSPVRSDMQTPATRAVRQIGQWRHVSSHAGDPMQRLGEWFDGEIGWNRRSWDIPGATNVTNMTIRDIGHSKLLSDPTKYHHWIDDGLLDFARVHTSEGEKAS
jgi:hypothetical protein